MASDAQGNPLLARHTVYVTAAKALSSGRLGRLKAGITPVIGSSTVGRNYLRPAKHKKQRKGASLKSGSALGALASIARNTARAARSVAPIFRNAPAWIKSKTSWSYVMNNTFNYTISGADLLDQFCVATSATTGNRMLSAIRLLALEIWVPPANTLVDATSDACLFFWDTQASGVQAVPPRPIFIESLGYDEPAYLKVRPPKNTICGAWHASNTTDSTAICHLQAAANTKVRLHVEIQFVTGYAGIAELAPRQVSNALVGATPGKLGLRGFPTGASATLVPDTNSGYDII